MRFQGQTAVVTGAARGIGFATAKRLASEGASVALFDLDGDAVRAAAETIVESGGRAAALQVDVSKQNEVRTAIDEVKLRYGGIQVLVNNAGIYPHVPFEQMTLERWRHIIAVNLDSTFLCSHATFPHMKAARYGRIVNFSSCVVLNGQANLTAYAAAKAGIVGFTRILAVESGGYGITANAVSPGLIETEGVIADLGGLFDEVVKTQTIKRRGQTTDITECIAYLASPAASFITGQTINVDCGVRFL